MNEEKQYISRIKLVDGTTVDIKDQEARLTLDSLFSDTVVLNCGTSTTTVDDITE